MGTLSSRKLNKFSDYQGGQEEGCNTTACILSDTVVTSFFTKHTGNHQALFEASEGLSSDKTVKTSCF